MVSLNYKSHITKLNPEVVDRLEEEQAYKLERTIDQLEQAAL